MRDAPVEQVREGDARQPGRRVLGALQRDRQRRAAAAWPRTFSAPAGTGHAERVVVVVEAALVGRDVAQVDGDASPRRVVLAGRGRSGSSPRSRAPRRARAGCPTRARTHDQRRRPRRPPCPIRRTPTVTPFPALLGHRPAHTGQHVCRARPSVSRSRSPGPGPEHSCSRQAGHPIGSPGRTLPGHDDPGVEARAAACGRPTRAVDEPHRLGTEALDELRAPACAAGSVTSMTAPRIRRVRRW